MVKVKRVITIVLVLFLMLSIVAGCTQKTDKPSDNNNKNVADDKNKDNTDKSGDDKGSDDKGDTKDNGNVLPIVDKPITLKYWMTFGGNAKEVITGLGENEVYQELAKRTNITMEFIHPAEGQETEQFNLMIASDDLPDIIETADRYKGGIDKAIADGMYIKLNDLVDKHAPNFKKVIESNELLKKEMYSDQGNLIGFGMICSPATGDAIDVGIEIPWYGPFIRQDWLDDLGLKVPVTIDDWYTALKAFKDQKNAEVPMLWYKSGIDTTGGVFIGAYDLAPAFYMKDGKVKYAPVEPEFKDYLTMVNKWYKEGLIDPDFPTRDDKSKKALYMGGKVGAHTGSTALVLETRAVDIKLVGAPYPQLAPDKPIHFRDKNNMCRGSWAVITKECKYPEEAVKWFDYHYTLDGFRLFNFGVEGKSYTEIDEQGRPKYVEYISKDNYKDFDKYNSVFRLHNGPYLKSDERSNPRRWMEDLESYRVMWNEQPGDYKLPPITLTDKEGKESATIMSQVDAYKDEMILKFIIGDEPLTKFDEYISKIKDMGIDKAIELRQDALQRFNNR